MCGIRGLFVKLILAFQFYIGSQNQTQVFRFAQQMPLPSKPLTP